MGRIATILEVVIDTLSKLKVALGGGDNRTVQYMQPAGSDSFPLPSDKAILIPSGRTGAQAAVGFYDPNNPPVAVAGEHRTYARDADGNIVSEIYQHADGTIEIKNDLGNIVLGNDGTPISMTHPDGININGVVFPGGGSIEAGLIEGTAVVDTTLDIALGSHDHAMAAHLHPVTTAPGTTGAAAPPNTLSPTPGT
jgi:hypothetical protein